MASSPVETEQSNEGFVRGLGLLDSTMIVAGSMIGSGIFIVSADIARQVGSPGWLLVVWLVTGLADGRGGPFVWRTSRHDAAGRRNVRLSERSIFAVLGISVRLDAFSGDRHGDDRGCICCVCSIYGNSHSADLRNELSD